MVKLNHYQLETGVEADICVIADSDPTCGASNASLMIATN